MILLVLLTILLGSYALLSAFRVEARRRGQLSLALLFLFTGMGHFAQTDAMSGMLPPWVPARTAIIWASGVFEWLLAVGLLMPRHARAAGVCAVAFLVLVFPGNVYAALNHVPMGGHEAGPAYLLVRAPFQALLIAWAYWFAVRRDDAPARRAS